MGQTGHFGEVFVGLAVLFLAGGGILLGVSLSGGLDDSPAGATAAQNDALILYVFLFVMGVGFGLFGLMAILSGWARHHDGFEW